MNSSIQPSIPAPLRKAVAAVLLALSLPAAASQELPAGSLAATGDSSATSTAIISHLGLDVRGAYVGSSTSALRDAGYYGDDEKVLHSAMSAHIKYSFSYSPSTRTGRLYPGAYQGIGLSVISFFDNSRIGSPVGVYLFQGAPVVRLAPRLTFDYEWNFGASFGWKKYHEDRPPVNLIVGSPINAYINLGFMLRYRLAPQWSVAAGIDMTHWSNGNTSWPNPGVNSIGARAGLIYSFDSRGSSHTLADMRDTEPVRPHFSYDLVVYGAARKRMIHINDTPQLLPGRFGVAGLNFAPMYNFNRFFRAGISADVQYDESSDLGKYWVDGTFGDDIKFRRPPFFHQVSLGLSARGELVMPIFSINAGMGYNILGNHDTRNFYQVLALKINVWRSVFLHVGYQLNSFRNPNNLMIGLGYRFHDRR